MPLNIPLPGDPGENLVGASQDLRNIFQQIMQNRTKQQELAETGRYHTGELELKKRHEQREDQLQKPRLDLLKAQFESQKALADWRKKGGGASGMGVGGKEEQFFQSLVSKDNPQLQTPEQIYEASNVLRQGGNTLSDGTKLNPLSPASRSSFDRLTKGGTYSGAAVPILKANQAEAELKVLQNMSVKDFEPYATTYAGFSPDQIMDTFKDDNESQKRLGNLIASQAAQYEVAQLRNRLARGEAGITATQELMGKSGQIIKTRFPRLSAKARMQASKRLDEYLEAALKASKSVGLGASSATNFNQSSGSSNNEEKVTLYRNGKKYSVPIGKKDEALSSGGFTLG